MIIASWTRAQIAKLVFAVVALAILWHVFVAHHQPTTLRPQDRARNARPYLPRSGGSAAVARRDDDAHAHAHGSAATGPDPAAAPTDAGDNNVRGGGDAAGETRRAAPQMRFMTVQTGVAPGWCRNMASAAYSGATVVSLGWGQAYAHRARPRWIVDFLSAMLRAPSPSADAKNHDDGIKDDRDDAGPWALDDVVLFADGADTMFTGADPAAILARFEHLAREDLGGRRDAVVFNAEANCYHQQLFDGPWGVKKGRCLAAYKRFDPRIRTKWRYLNAGAWVATVRAALWLFGNVSRALDADRGLWCDQSVIGGMMLRQRAVAGGAGVGSGANGGGGGLIALDTRNTIFLPTYHLRVKTDVCAGTASAPAFAWPPSLVLCHSRRAPAVLHFNGRSGSAGIEAEQRVRYHARYTGKGGGGGGKADPDDPIPEAGWARLPARVRLWDTRGPVTSRPLGELCPRFA